MNLTILCKNREEIGESALFSQSTLVTRIVTEGAIFCLGEHILSLDVWELQN